MASIYFSLFCILVVATLAPFVASLVPGRAVPEVVFLVFGGALWASTACSGESTPTSSPSSSWAT